MVQYNTGLRNLCPLERDSKELRALRPGHQNFTNGPISCNRGLESLLQTQKFHPIPGKHIFRMGGYWTPMGHLSVYAGYSELNGMTGIYMSELGILIFSILEKAI